MQDFVRLDDCIDSVVTTLDEIDDGALSPSTGIYTSSKRSARMAAEQCGYAPEVISLSDKPAGVFARGGGVSAQADFGFTFRLSFSDGIRQALAFYS